MKKTNPRLLACLLGLLAAIGIAGGEETPAQIRLAGCRIKPADQVTLAVNQSGILKSVPREGNWVEADQRVILLEDDLARAALAVAERDASNDVDVRYAETGSEVARLEYEQALKVNETVKGSLTVTDVRRRKLELDQSLLQAEQARFKQSVMVLKRDEAAAHLKAFHVVAPFSGTVNKVLKHKGEAVRQGDPILELVNTRRVRVEGYLNVAHRQRVVPGTVVHVTSEHQLGESVVAPLVGRIVFVDKVVQPVTQQVRVWADVENPDELLIPGLTAVMTISPVSPPLVSVGR